ncbi:putative integral membrane protein [Candida parapsilosis]|uniref:Transmembrane protein 135 N-terminal domain-containing protein n=2 Tax=Candida parapsilosis TaxID=5480 RepID=G8BDK5_CANPC|nr:uncharacterized protein CPAR2_209970 [Candida parapsilosis]KAF6054499.1 putative integral membrane protein [Candida parapsilosis]KAF6056476.1 hypothetical protein FOB59_000988 [Candida parapsilosis]KAF6059410.1 putative integral membrane protein [Candida parapsilosis]KAF6068165.1 putative integral membrane protein [Candida parapsilosis]KAI5905353.1 hypothetical protein K4G60_g4612 [Candida parapsilosis]
MKQPKVPLTPYRDLAYRVRQLKPILNVIKRQLRIIVYIYRISTKNVIKAIRAIFLQRSTIVVAIFAYLCEVVPNLLKNATKHLFELKAKGFSSEAWQIIIAPLQADRSPIFMIRLVATLNAMNPIFMKLLYPYVDGEYFLFTTTFLAGLVSSILNFPRFQELKIEEDKFYTFDWTCILVTKAIDTVISTTVSPHVSAHTNDLIDLSVILVSTYCVMTAWWFKPDKLSPQMVNWITKMTRIDPSVQKGVQELHEGTVSYTTQEASPEQDSFQSFAASRGKNSKLGDLTQHEKLPCEVLHEFTTHSCLKHTFDIFVSQFISSLRFYSYVNLFTFVFFRGFRGNMRKVCLKTIKSSLFVSSLTTIHWGCICFIRNHHPKWFGQKYWDILGIKIGSALAGLSVLFESAKKRQDLMLFVTPKALGTFFDAADSTKRRQLETAAFSFSFAILVAFARSSPARLRGVVGKGLSYMVM